MVSSGSSKRILIADDEADIRLLINRMLGKDYTILEAADGDEAVKVARVQKPDLILMDIMMPKMDGLEATKIIKTNIITKHIPIIALTSYAMKGDRERTIEAGCDMYIAKPVDILEVLKAIKHYLAEK